MFTDLNSALVITLFPLLIVGQGVLYVWLAFRFGGEDMLSASVFQAALQKLVQSMPEIVQFSGEKQLLVLLLNQFSFFLLLIPTMIAISVATFSIVDEKLTGSLEALLATPVRTWELLLGKVLSGAIPALVMTWISAGVLLLIVPGMGWGDLSGLLINATWFLLPFKKLSKLSQQPKLWLTEPRIDSCQLTYAFFNSDNCLAPIIPPEQAVFALKQRIAGTEPSGQFETDLLPWVIIHPFY